MRVVLLWACVCWGAFSLPGQEPRQEGSAPPTSFGSLTGPVFIGQRTVVENYTGWGWVKQPNEPWSKARWVMLLERPGERPAPHRFLPRPDADNGMQYRLYGRFAAVSGYEPFFDVLVDVFVLEGYELIGPGEPLKLQPPKPSDRLVNRRPPSRITGRPTGSELLRSRNR